MDWLQIALWVCMLLLLAPVAYFLLLTLLLALAGGKVPWKYGAWMLVGVVIGLLCHTPMGKQ